MRRNCKQFLSKNTSRRPCGLRLVFFGGEILCILLAVSRPRCKLIVFYFMILAMHERAVHIVIVNYLFRSVFFDARAAGVAEVSNFVTAAQKRSGFVVGASVSCLHHTSPYHIAGA